MKKYIEYIESEREKTYKSSQQFIHGYRNALIEEFENRCAYCESKLGVTSNAEIDQFYPKSKYPKKAFDVDNLLLCCSVCNRNKSNHFPLDEDGSPMLLHPRFDDYTKHIKFQTDGFAIPLTKRGEATIEILKLNRPELVDDRKTRELEADFLKNYGKVNTDYYNVFIENIKNIKVLNSISDVTEANVREYLKNMLFANVITSLETYLCDAFINTVKSDKIYLRKFVESFDNFKKEKFELQELFVYYDNINEKATKAMLDVIYHDLPKVRGMYADTLNVTLPDLSLIYKAVLKRHDFVHRNGKTKDGVKHNVETKDITELCQLIETFVSEVNEQIKEL